MSPFYDFRCKNDHITEEYFGTISGAKTFIKCPKCKEKAERLISTGVGSSFYGAPFSYSSDKKASEVREAMNDFRTGKGDKKSEEK